MIMIGINYKTCATHIRERLTFTKAQTIEALQNLKNQQINEVVLLATCHRTEFYSVEIEHIPKIIAFILETYKQNGGTDDIKQYLTIYKDDRAIRHLLNVTAGLESLVLGEDQILSQVKQAVELAREAQTLGKITHKVFREAITLTKKIKNQSKISQYPLSISHIAIQFLKEKIGTLKNCKGLIIGLGQMNELAIKYLLDEAVDTLYVTNRTHGKALELQEIYQELIPISYEERYDVLNHVDFVISATASPHVILKLEQMPHLSRHIYLLDIAMPCDIDKNIATLPMAEVYDLEDLEEIANRNQEMRTYLSKIATIEIEQKLIQINHWLENLEIEQVANDLNQYCMTVKEHTLHFIKHQLKDDTSDDLLDYIMTETLKRCIRQPIAHLMTLEDEEQRKKEMDVLRVLFGLGEK